MSRSKVSSVEIETARPGSRARVGRSPARGRGAVRRPCPGAAAAARRRRAPARAPIVATPAARSRSSARGPTPGSSRTSNGARNAASRPGPHDREAAGLSPVGRHLRDDLAGGDAERAGQRGRAADGRLHRFGELAGGEEVGCDLAEVEVALVDPGLLDGRDDLADRAPDRPRVLAVEGMAGADEDRVRAAAQRLGAAHRRVDAVPARDVVRGRDHAAALRVAADDERLSAQGGILELLDRGEEGVEIEVRDDHRHQE